MATSVAAPSLGILQRLSSLRERYGLSSVINKSVDIVLHKAFKTSIYTVVWLDVDLLAKLAPADPRFTFRFLTADEIARYAQDPDYYLSPTLADRVREGRELCFAALAGDILAAFGCYTLGSVPPEQASGVAMSFPTDVAYMSYGFTHPDFRGSRLHGLIMGFALQELAARGITKLVSLVAWSNLASLKSCYRLGYQNLGNMIAIGGRQRAVGIYPRAAKCLGVRFGRNAAN